MASNNINSYKDRMTGSFGLVKTNPKTKKPVQKSVKRSGKK